MKRYVFGIATCAACEKWHPAVLEEEDGPVSRVAGLACAHCPETDSCIIARLGKRQTEAEATAALLAWLDGNRPALNQGPE